MIRRPRVVVYVTRENPETGLDELLVFDAVDRPEFSAVVPGGGVESAESFEDAVVREIREETGLVVRPVRELGVLEQPGRLVPDVLHESHFWQAALTGPAPEQWEHRIAEQDGSIEAGLVHCRWVTLEPNVELWGQSRGALVNSLVRQRVVAYVTRERGGRRELLTIEAPGDPGAGIQVPAGRIDYWESLEEGLLRELAEETGLTAVRIVGELPDFECTYRTFSHNHAFHLVAEDETPDEWLHRVHGEGVDAGQMHLCRWQPLSTGLELWNGRDPMLAKLPV